MKFTTDDLDLHQLNVIDALDKFVSFYNLRISKKNYSEFTVIHGYGSSGVGGDIRVKLRKLLKESQDVLLFKYGEDSILINPGVTIIYPKKALFGSNDIIGLKILELCKEPKVFSKILNKLHKYGEDKVSSSLKKLEKKGLLVLSNKGKYKQYQIAIKE